MNRERALTDGLEALRLIVRGHTATSAADAMYLSADVVRLRLRILYRILGARTAAHAVAIAGMQRLLTAEDLKAAVTDRRTGSTEEGA